MKIEKKRPFYPNLLLVSGSGRDTGKTLLACQIIQKFTRHHRIAALKISRHRHEHGEEPGLQLAGEGNGYRIWYDTVQSAKDSGRFLNSGAELSIYIETTDLYLNEAFSHAMRLIRPGSMVVCESGGLVHLVQPALMIFVQEGEGQISPEKAAVRARADLVVDLKNITDGGAAESVLADDTRWRLADYFPLTST